MNPLVFGGFIFHIERFGCSVREEEELRFFGGPEEVVAVHNGASDFEAFDIGDALLGIDGGEGGLAVIDLTANQIVIDEEFFGRGHDVIATVSKDDQEFV